MKNLAVILVMLFSVSCGFSATSPVLGDVPKEVKEAFKRAYPNAEDVEWEEEDGNYEVEFEVDGYEMESLYSATGTELETVVEIEGTDLPKAVFDQVRREYADWEIDDVDEEDHNGQKAYEIEVEHEDGRELELLYSSTGMLQRKEVEDKD